MNLSLYHPVSIGSLSLSGNVFLAPLAGYTEKFYRSMCLSMGADLAYTEMVSCEGVARNSEKTVELMERGEGEKNLAIQLFAPDADTALRSLEGALAYKPALIDFNCGCPVPKVIKTGCGSALLKTPEVIGEIIKAVSSEVGPSIPVTVKIRTGWDLDSINYLKTAEIAFSSGANAICMHARTRSQLYFPTADWSTLADLKAHFPEKTIIGSGDLFQAKDGIAMLEQTGIDAVMFARGAIGNPFVFQQFRTLAEGTRSDGSAPEIDVPLEDKKKAAMTHLLGLASYLGENVACREMRKHAAAYLKGIPNSSKVRQAVTQSTTIKEYESAFALLG